MRTMLSSSQGYECVVQSRNVRSGLKINQLAELDASPTDSLVVGLATLVLLFSCLIGHNPH